MNKLSYSEFLKLVKENLRRQCIDVNTCNMNNATSCSGIACYRCPFEHEATHECTVQGKNKLVLAEELMIQELLDII